MDDEIDALTVLGEQLVAAVFNRNSLDHIAELISAGAPVWYQNEVEGLSPLHAAVYVQDVALVKYLIEQGAVWNAGICRFSTSVYSLIIDYFQVDKMGHAAGDIALSYNNSEIYTLIRDAGIRSGNG